VRGQRPDDFKSFTFFPNSSPLTLTLSPQKGRGNKADLPCHYVARSHQIIFFALTFLLFAIGSVRAQTESWLSAATGQTLDLKILKPENFNSNQPSPVIFYLENLAAPRAGTDSDDAIIHDFLTNGYLVITLDYAHDAKARVPFINADLFALRNGLFKKTLLQQYKIDSAHIFIVPSGDRLLRDVIYYRAPDRTLAMDIIYPAHPATPPGSVLEFSCDNINRMGNDSLAICSDTALDGEATEGLITAMADHPVPAPYKGIDLMPDCAWKIKAAVRTLRTAIAPLDGNGKIAPVGFSRGSGMALMLVTTKGMAEFEGHGENTNANSDVQGAVVMSGRFTYLELMPNDHMIPRYDKTWGDRTNHLEVWRRAGAVDYLTNATLPLFLTINRTEGPDAQLQMAALRKRLADFGSDEIFMMDEQPRGHKVTLVPEILSAMNAYLKSRLN
jgi:hypothetical protein